MSCIASARRRRRRAARAVVLVRFPAGECAVRTASDQPWIASADNDGDGEAGGAKLARAASASSPTAKRAGDALVWRQVLDAASSYIASSPENSIEHGIFFQGDLLLLAQRPGEGVGQADHRARPA